MSLKTKSSSRRTLSRLESCLLVVVIVRGVRRSLAAGSRSSEVVTLLGLDRLAERERLARLGHVGVALAAELLQVRTPVGCRLDGLRACVANFGRLDEASRERFDGIFIKEKKISLMKKKSCLS